MSDGSPRPKDYRYLTRIQKRYYDFIRAFIAKNDLSPSLADIARHFKVNNSTAHRMVQKLQQSGAIYRSQKKARSIRPLPLKFREIREYKVSYSGFAANRSNAANGVKAPEVDGSGE